jgi:hypothetical protein
MTGLMCGIRLQSPMQSRKNIFKNNNNTNVFILNMDLSSTSFLSRYGLDIAPQDPTTIFQLQQRIGKGSYGSVYKGWTSFCSLLLKFFFTLILNLFFF